ncbi:MAG TPA: CoA transferase [Gaiellaceae bacterium]|nr:CoA transferase [Gaiellaceae bacterium]HET8652266.1 CoA transferase [Gaiellaceae bacterium]
MRVLDLTSSLAGPYCTQILAALGGDVVKVEHPQRGDEARAWGPAFAVGGSVMFFAANAGKRSLALDVSTEAGREALLRLTERSAVFVQSLRPGTAERLGLGAADLRARNDRLVYCSIGAFGRRGPLARDPGYDPLMQAAGGIMSVTGEPGRPGIRVGASLIDLGTAVWAALAVVAAIHEGGGRVLDLSLYETTLALLPYQLTNYLTTGEIPGREGSAFALIAPYQVFRTRDGELMIVAANDRLFRGLCDVVGRADLADDPRFATNPLRVANRAELIAELAQRFLADGSAAWLARLREAGVPAAPVQDVAQVADSEQTAALGILQELAGFRTVALPFSADGERPLYATPPPALGEHSADVLAEAGYSEAEVGELAAAGVTRLPDEGR